MTLDDLRLLAARATIVEDSPEKLRSDVHARIGSMRRRRQIAAIAVAVIAVVVALSAGTAWVKLTETSPPPVKPPAPTPTRTPEPDKGASARPLVYSEGHRVHVGDKTIDAGREVHYVDATDEGAVFVTGPRRGDGPNRIWFTDGTDPILLGHASGRDWGYDVVTSTTGPYVVWWQTDKQVSNNTNDPGEHVVYDTAKQKVAARFGGTRGSVRGFHGAYVYWIPDDRAWCLDFDGYRGECRRYKGIMRLEVSTGRQEQVSWASYQAVVRSDARTLVRSGSTGALTEVNPYFWRVGSRLVAINGRPPRVAGWDYRDNLAPLADVRTGKPLRLRVPADFRAADVFQLVQWLNADQVAVFAYCCGTERDGYPGYPIGGSETADSGDLFTCRLSSGACSLAVKRSDDGYEVPLAD